MMPDVRQHDPTRRQSARRPTSRLPHAIPCGEPGLQVLRQPEHRNAVTVMEMVRLLTAKLKGFDYWNFSYYFHVKSSQDAAPDSEHWTSTRRVPVLPVQEVHTASHDIQLAANRIPIP